MSVPPKKCESVRSIGLSRRRFLADAGAAALAFSAVKPETVRGSVANSKVDLAIVGGSCAAGPLTVFGRLFPGSLLDVLVYRHPFGVGYLVATSAAAIVSAPAARPDANAITAPALMGHVNILSLMLSRLMAIA